MCLSNSLGRTQKVHWWWEALHMTKHIYIASHEDPYIFNCLQFKGSINGSMKKIIRRPETCASLIMTVAFGPWPWPKEIGKIFSDISLSAATHDIQVNPLPSHQSGSIMSLLSLTQGCFGAQNHLLNQKHTQVWSFWGIVQAIMSSRSWVWVVQEFWCKINMRVYQDLMFWEDLVVCIERGNKMSKQRVGIWPAYFNRAAVGSLPGERTKISGHVALESR